MRPSSLNICREHEVDLSYLPGVLRTILDAGKTAGKIQYYEVDAWTLEVCLRNVDQTWRVIKANISDYKDLLGVSSKDLLVQIFADEQRNEYSDLMSETRDKDPNRWEFLGDSMRYLLARMCLVYVHNIRLGSKLKLLRELTPGSARLRLDDNVNPLPMVSSFTAQRLCALLCIPYEELPTLLDSFKDPSCNKMVAWRLKAGV